MQCFNTGLVGLLRQNNGGNKTEILQPFPPGHFMVYNVNKHGKVDFDRKIKFHSFIEKPLHWQYQGIELLEGKSVV